MTRRSLRQVVDTSVLLQAGLVVVVAMVAATGYLTYRDHADEADRARAAAVLIERLRADVIRGETAVRGYALTGDLSFLVPYTRGRSAVDRDVKVLRKLLTPRERPVLERATDSAMEWRRVFAGPILELVAARRGDAVAFARRGIGKRRIDAFNAALDDLAARVDRRVRGDRRTAASTGRRGVVLIAVAVVAALFAALWLRRRLARDVLEPMQELAAAAGAVAGGKLTARVTPAGVRETHVAGDAFNHMASDIERTVSELQEVDALKSRFVASVSHELRTPLTSISGYVEELLDEEFGPLSQDQRDALAVIARNSAGLGTLIDDLLLLARLEAGAVELSSERVDLRALAGALVEELRPVAAARGIQLRLDENGGAAATGDARQIRQALANLLSNAIKYSREGEPVDVRIRSQQAEAMVEVADRGVGIPPEELARLGERFFRASTAGATKGTGLGLSITRELAERLGGRLEARSEVGRGSTFRLVLPLG